MGLNLDARIVIPGQLLDTRNEVVCSCGYKRDCGYMSTTAERTAELHSERCSGTCVVVVSPAKPRPRENRETKIKISRHGGW